MKKKLLIIILVLVVLVILSIFIYNVIYNLFFKPIVIIAYAPHWTGERIPQVMPHYIKVDKSGRKYEGYSEERMEKVKTFDSETMKILNEKLSLLYNEIKDTGESYGSYSITIDGKTYDIYEFSEKATTIYKEIREIID